MVSPKHNEADCAHLDNNRTVVECISSVSLFLCRLLRSQAPREPQRIAVDLETSVLEAILLQEVTTDTNAGCILFWPPIFFNSCTQKVHFWAASCASIFSCVIVTVKRLRTNNSLLYLWTSDDILQLYFSIAHCLQWDHDSNTQDTGKELHRCCTNIQERDAKAFTLQSSEYIGW